MLTIFFLCAISLLPFKETRRNDIVSKSYSAEKKRHDTLILSAKLHYSTIMQSILLSGFNIYSENAIIYRQANNVYDGLGFGLICSLIKTINIILRISKRSSFFGFKCNIIRTKYQLFLKCYQFYLFYFIWKSFGKTKKNIPIFNIKIH